MRDLVTCLVKFSELPELDRQSMLGVIHTDKL